MGWFLLWSVLALAAAWWWAWAYLERYSPVWRWFLVGVPMVVVRVLWTWRDACIALGWTGQRRSGRVAVGGVIVSGREVRPKVPRLVLSVRGGVLVVRVRLLPGQTPEMYSKGIEALRHAWRVQRVRVSSPGLGFVRMVLTPFDALSEVVQIAEVDDAVGVAPGDADGRRAEPLVAALGIRDGGRPWVVNFRLVPHYLVVGVTQSGKSTLIRTLIARLAVSGAVILGIDLKGALELSLYRDRLSGLARTRSEAAELLTKVLGIVLERAAACQRAGVTAVWDLPEPPAPIVVVVDEIAELFLSDRSERELREIITTTLQRIAQMGAALDVHLVLAGQRVGSELGSGVTLLRSQLSGRICLRVSDRETAEMVLSDLAPDAVAMALAITPEEAGMAIAADGSGGWERVRAAMTAVSYARSVATRFGFMRTRLPGVALPGDDDMSEEV